MALKNFIKENFVLVVGLTLPVLLVVLFFFASVLPKSMATPPQYEMLFTTTRYDSQNMQPYNVNFLVKDGVLTAHVNKVNTQYPQTYKKTLMAYDGKTQSVREIPYDISEVGTNDNADIVFSAVRSLKVDSSSKSPDGYEFDNAGYGSGGFPAELFWGGSYGRSGARVKKGAVAYKIPNNNGQPYYYGDIQFVGWILQK